MPPMPPMPAIIEAMSMPPPSPPSPPPCWPSAAISFSIIAGSAPSIVAVVFFGFRTWSQAFFCLSGEARHSLVLHSEHLTLVEGLDPALEPTLLLRKRGARATADLAHLEPPELGLQPCRLAVVLTGRRRPNLAPHGIGRARARRGLYRRPARRALGWERSLQRRRRRGRALPRCEGGVPKAAAAGRRCRG
eukprot:scaffold112884_cov51-Phaeocystis_antarctica.AAC.1